MSAHLRSLVSKIDDHHPKDINIDRSNTFRGLSSKNNPQEETENTNRCEDESSSSEEEDGEQEQSEQLAVIRPLQRGLTAEKSAEFIYKRSLSGCSWIQSDKMKKIPKFSTNEMMMGLVLGSGCFGNVFEVRGFHLKNNNDGGGGRSNNNAIKPNKLSPRNKSDLDDEEVTPGEIESRNFIAKHCYRNNGDARYAIKKLRTGIKHDESNFMNGMADLANETLYLASLRHHPNIIKLRGIAVENMFSEDFFLVLDRLYDTLQVRILKWKKKKNKSKGFVKSYLKDRNGEKKRKLFEERMQYAMDLVAAIAYIHDHRIIHRDLKPDNIGFDIRNDIKVFDFGLARELPPSKTINNINSPDEIFHLSSAGSPRYMAPEVGLGQKYNQACDIYSFGLIFWEMMTLKRPYPKERTMGQLQENVWAPWGPRHRPPLPSKMEESIRTILQKSWNHDFRARPKAPKLLAALKTECLKLREDMRISHTQRRSTYVLSERASRSAELKFSTITTTSSSSQQQGFQPSSSFIAPAGGASGHPKSPPRPLYHNDSTARLSIHSATQFDSSRFNEDGTESSW